MSQSQVGHFGLFSEEDQADGLADDFEVGEEGLAGDVFQAKSARFVE